MADFKPNVYPLMYWGLAYGAAAGLLLLILQLLSRNITLFWIPVFLAGMGWGAFRNYRRQKERWQAQTGVQSQPQSVRQEFQEAVSDIASASQEVFNQDEEDIDDQYRNTQ